MLVHELIKKLSEHPPGATVVLADTLDKHWLVLCVEPSDVLSACGQPAVAIWLGAGFHEKRGVANQKVSDGEEA